MLGLLLLGFLCSPALMAAVAWRVFGDRGEGGLSFMLLVEVRRMFVKSGEPGDDGERDGGSEFRSGGIFASPTILSVVCSSIHGHHTVCCRLTPETKSHARPAIFFVCLWLG